jgi:hypothetical protein
MAHRVGAPYPVKQLYGAIPAQANAQPDFSPLFDTAVNRLTPRPGQPPVSIDSVVENLSHDPALQLLLRYPLSKIREQFDAFIASTHKSEAEKQLIFRVLTGLVAPGHVPVGIPATAPPPFAGLHVPVGGGHGHSPPPTGPHVPVGRGHGGPGPTHAPPSSAHVPVGSRKQ